MQNCAMAQKTIKGVSTDIGALKIDFSAIANIPEWLYGAKGEQGEKGEKGEKGDPFTFEDLTAVQLAMLRGPKGEKGDPGDGGSNLIMSSELPYYSSPNTAVLYTGPTIPDTLISGRIYMYIGDRYVDSSIGASYPWKASVGNTVLYSSTPYQDIAVGDILMAYNGGEYTNITTVTKLHTNSSKFTISAANGLTLSATIGNAWEPIAPYRTGMGLCDTNGVLQVSVGNGVTVDPATNTISVDAGSDVFVETMETVTEAKTASPKDVAALINF